MPLPTLLPAVYFAGTTQGLNSIIDYGTPWLDVRQDWTVRFSFGINGAIPGGGYRTAFLMGSITYATSYIWFGSLDDTDDFYLQIGNGGVFTDSATVTISDLAWNDVGLAYDATAHTIKVRVNGTTIDTVSINLSAWPYAGTTKKVLGYDLDAAPYCNMFFAYERTWQRVLTNDELDAEALSSFPILHTDLLSDTPLLAFDDARGDDLDDHLGHMTSGFVDNRGYFVFDNDPTAYVGPDVDTGACIPGGSMVLSYNGIMRFYDPTSGYELGQRTFFTLPAFANGNQIGAPIFAVDGELLTFSFGTGTGTGGYIWSADLQSVIASGFPSGAEAAGQVPGYADGVFYLPFSTNVANVGSSVVKRVGVDGVSLSTITIPNPAAGTHGYEIDFCGAAPDGSVLYHAGEDPTSSTANAGHVFTSAIPAGTIGSDLLTLGSTHRVCGLHVMTSGDVVVGDFEFPLGPMKLILVTPPSTTVWSVTLNASPSIPNTVKITSAEDASKIYVHFTTTNESLCSYQAIDPADGSVLEDHTPFMTVASVYSLGLTADAVPIGVCGGLICPPDTVGYIGTPYSSDFTTQGGVPPYTYALTAGSLPPGLSLGASSGTVSGTPTTAGYYPYSASSTDDDGTVFEADCQITISSATVYPMCRKCRFPLPFDMNRLSALFRIEFLIQSGVSPDAEITINLSKDGGYTWPITRTMTAGAIGAYDWRVYAVNFGQGRNWVCEFITSEPYFWALIQCYVDIEAGTS